ncbi:MAG: Ig-like domain-containing protein [Rhodoferax sp.]|nr:Ig-like domain-containing protein [Rhodoferax sp.]
MKKYESYARVLPWFMALILSVLLAACGGGGGRDPILGSGEIGEAAPMVTAVNPSNNNLGVPTNTKVSATFSVEMDPLTLNASTFTLQQGATKVPGTTSYSGITAVFTPTGALASNTTYTATITTGAKSLHGNALAANYVWSWTTAAAADTTAPTVTLVTPANAATNVATNTKVSVTFSEAMDPLTLNASTFTLKQGATTVPGTTSYSGVTAVFIPTSDLASNTTYTATITSSAKDLASNALTANYAWSWTTAAAADTTAPTITLVNPANAATNVAINTKVSVTFSEAMDPLTLNTASITLKQGATVISGTTSYSGVTAVFTPTYDLANNTAYSATITTGAKDLTGNALASDYVWYWTTATTADTTVPTVTLVNPWDEATHVDINTKVSATFSKAMDPLTLSTASFTLIGGANATAVAGTTSYSGVTAVFTPTNALASNTIYIAKITTGAKDLAGNALASNYFWTWTTAADTTTPIVIPTGPAMVNLDCAANFVILAGSTVTNTGPTIISNGDVGGSVVTGFPPGTINGGTLHTNDVLANNAKLCLTAAYNDAAGRTTAPIAVSGNIGGQTLAPGLYRSTSTLAISSGDLTLAGPADAVWIFQIASTLTTTAGRKIILSGGAQASNIFWQVGTSATLGTTSAFKGTILADQSITLQTGAVLNGRALTRIGAVTLDSNSVVKP